MRREAAALLGRQVTVTLARRGGADAVIAEGQLLGFGAAGDIEVLEDDGMVHYCWPMLDIREREAPA